MRAPISHGGVCIRDSKLMNIAIADKLLWILVTGENTWWKEIIIKKVEYLDSNIWIGVLRKHNGSSIWRLCKVVGKLIKEGIYWVSINGKRINTWQDKIVWENP